MYGIHSKKLYGFGSTNNKPINTSMPIHKKTAHLIAKFFSLAALFLIPKYVPIIPPPIPTMLPITP